VSNLIVVRSAFSRASVAARLILSLLLLCSLGQAAGPVAVKGIARFSQVNEHLYRGGQPGKAAITALQQLGMHAVIDLRGRGERAEAEEKQVTALGMKYYSVPLSPFAAPTAAQIATVLALVEDSGNWPVFVHCKHGKDRTGTIVACYRITHDQWPNERALIEAKDHGLSRFERGMRDFITTYRPASVLGVAAGSTR
jgi:tyrosine-protein phosphatase SIW14